MSGPVVYQPIGVVRCSVTDPLPPEAIRAVESRLVLELRFTSAGAALEVGQHLWVVYHLHRTPVWEERYMPELFAWRGARRPNPLGITLVRVTALEGATIAVVGLDAVDGSPVLDVKPYKPVFDAPPVHPAEREW